MTVIAMQLNKIHNIDALSGLRSLPDNAIDCIVTSPPYFQMRDYGIVDVEWGDGWSGQLGQEPTRELFVAHLIEIFDECRRVLKPSGTLWVNLADSYHNKSLCNIPNKFADEMIGAGWILRNEIIWHKPSCIPSGATDRFTTDYEKLFFFTKSQKYAFNQQFEPYAKSTIKRYEYPMSGNGKNGIYKEISGAPCDKMMHNNPKGRNMRAVWKIPFEGSKEGHFAMFPTKLVETPILAGSPEDGTVLDPFMGGGTTAIVAKRTGRNYIGFELNPEYIEIAERRVG
ncbi:MAG: site-specific DNA-methyltransferase [Rikenellaceae bacterium]